MVDAEVSDVRFPHDGVGVWPWHSIVPGKAEMDTGTKTPLFVKVECEAATCDGCQANLLASDEGTQRHCEMFYESLIREGRKIVRLPDCRRAESLARAYQDVVEAVLTSGADFGECVAVALDKLREAKGE